MTTLEPTTTTVGPSTMNPNEFSLNTSLADQFAEFDSVEFLKTSIPVRPPTLALCRDWRDPRRAMLGVKKGEGGGGCCGHGDGAVLQVRGARLEVSSHSAVWCLPSSSSSSWSNRFDTRGKITILPNDPFGCQIAIPFFLLFIPAALFFHFAIKYKVSRIRSFLAKYFSDADKFNLWGAKILFGLALVLLVVLPVLLLLVWAVVVASSIPPATVGATIGLCGLVVISLWSEHTFVVVAVGVAGFMHRATNEGGGLCGDG